MQLILVAQVDIYVLQETMHEDFIDLCNKTHFPKNCPNNENLGAW